MAFDLDRAVDEFMARLVERNPGEPEFHQAVREVIRDLLPFVESHGDYKREKILERLTEPDRVISFRVAWEDESGEVQVNRGYRVQFNNAIGPYKGGLRFHPSVTQGMLKFLGFEQTFKNSLTTLPMGGAKGGADFDPRGRSDREVMRFCQAFMTELYRYIGAHTDVPAGDIGVGAREISYLFGQYKRLMNEFTPTLTGKGLAYGGSLVRTEATGYGAVYFAEDMLAAHDDGLEGKACVISGSGNVAQHTAEKLIQLGAKVVTFSDSSGFIHDPDGIDAEKLDFVIDLKTNRRGRIQEYAEHFGVEYHASARPWNVACDLAFPCATQNEIDASDARALVDGGVRAVVEGANMPTTIAGMEVLQKSDVLYAPSKAANAGGVAVSGLEQTQNMMRLSWTREEVNLRLREIMKRIHDQCVDWGTTRDGVDYVKGANIAGFRKVADAMLGYGIL